MIRLRNLLSEIGQTDFQRAMSKTGETVAIGFNRVAVKTTIAKHSLGDRVKIVKFVRETTPSPGAGSTKKHKTRTSITYNIYIDEKFVGSAPKLDRAIRAAKRKLGINEYGVSEIVEAKKIPISKIKNIQLVSNIKVGSLAKKIKSGKEIPPIEVEKLPNGQYRMVDGNHRLAASKAAGKKFIAANVHGAGYGKRWRKKMFSEERDYKDEYKKFQSSKKSKKYRAELNKYNRDKGTYGNNDGQDASHKGGKISGTEPQSKNRGRREKSRLKKEEDMIKLTDLLPEKVTGKQTCSNCKFFISDTSECVAVSPPEVKPEGWCKLWREGTPTTSDKNPPREVISKEDSNYTDGNLHEGFLRPNQRPPEMRALYTLHDKIMMSPDRRGNTRLNAGRHMSRVKSLMNAVEKFVSTDADKAKNFSKDLIKKAKESIGYASEEVKADPQGAIIHTEAALQFLHDTLDLVASLDLGAEQK